MTAAVASAPGKPASARGRLTCSHPQPQARSRLVCFAHAGGGPAAYRRWSSFFAPHVEVWTAILPGRAARCDEPFERSWERLDVRFGHALIKGGGTGPPALRGYNLGGFWRGQAAGGAARPGPGGSGGVGGGTVAGSPRPTAEPPVRLGVPRPPPPRLAVADPARRRRAHHGGGYALRRGAGGCARCARAPRTLRARPARRPRACRVLRLPAGSPFELPDHRAGRAR